MPKHNNIVRTLLKRPIAFHPTLARLTGSVPAALMLSQAIYWTDVVNETQPKRGGWFFKTQAEWTRETTLSRWEQESARKLLKKWDFWSEDRRGQPARLWFCLDLEKLAKAITQYVEKPQSCLGKEALLDCEQTASDHAGKPQTISETTTESTSENLGRSASRSLFSNASKKTPQQERFAIISRLAERAVGMLEAEPGLSDGDLAENLKGWAAQHGMPYFDAWPGAASPIQQAIIIAVERCSVRSRFGSNRLQNPSKKCETEFETKEP
jgi:hypothetical protein